MSLSNVLQPNNYDIFGDSISVENVNTVTINNAPYPPGGGALPVLVANKFLRTNATPTALWADITPNDLTGGSNNQFIGKRAGTIQFTDIIPSDIAQGGTARQLLQTNAAGTSTEWTSDVDIPGNLSLNSAAGVSGQVIRKTGPTTQTWANVTAGDLAPGTSNQVLQTNAGGTGVVWSTDVVVPGTISTNSNITGATVQSIGNINSVNGDLILSNIAAKIDIVGASTQINCGGTVTSNKLNLTNDLQFNSISGTTGKIIKKTGATSQAWSDLAAADIKGGLNNQILQSNGTNGVFNSNITIPGSLIMLGTATASGLLNFLGNVQFVSASGVAGQYIRKTGATTQTWSNIAVADITPGSNGQILSTTGGVAAWTNISALNAYMRFYNNTPYDINTGANVFITNGVQQANSGSPFTFNVGAGTFTCAISGTYTWNFNTILSTHNAQSKFLISDGTTTQCAQQIDYLVGLTTEQPFSYSGTFAATLGQVWSVAFASFGVGGVCNISGQDATYLCPTTTLEIIRL